jgi:hypothetical protein
VCEDEKEKKIELCLRLSWKWDKTHSFVDELRVV